MRQVMAAAVLFLAGHGVVAAQVDKAGVLPSGGYAKAAWALIESRQADRGGENGWRHLEEAERLLGVVVLEPRFAEDAALARRLEAVESPDTPLAWLNELFYIASHPAEAPELARLAEAFVAALVDAGVFREISAAGGAGRVLAPAPEGRLLKRSMHTPMLRQLLRACLAEGAIGRRRGSGDVVESVSRMYSIARIAGDQGFTIESLTGVAAADGASSEVVNIVMSGKGGPELWPRLLEVVGDEPPLAPLTFGVGVARLEALDCIDHFFDSLEEELAEEKPAAEAARLGEVIRRQGAGAIASQAAQNAKAEEFFGPALRLAALPRHAREASGDSIPDEFEEELPLAYEPLGTCLPALGNLFLSYDAAEMMWGGARLVLALEVYRARHGAYPETLAAMVPEVLPALPGDPFCAEGFRYRRIDAAEDRLGRGYLLYSVGLDGEDNGGREAENRVNAIGLGRTGRGFDFVINSED